MAHLTKIKKNFIIFAGALSLFLFSGTNALAARTGCPTEGFVPCGTKGCPCKLCDLFDMIHRIVQFIMIDIAPAIAVLLMAVAGFYYIISPQDPGNVIKAKTIFKNVTIGLIIIYGSYLAVNFLLGSFGIAEWTGLGSWYKITCN